MSTARKMRTVIGVALPVLALLAVGGAATYVAWSGPGGGTPGPEEAAEANAIEVTTLTPRLDKKFSVTGEAPAYVEPYYRADLEARVAGPVESIHVSIGDRVEKGQTLVRVHVPDLVAEVAEMNALIEQRKCEKELSERMKEVAGEAVTTARINIRLMQARLASADAELAAKNTMHQRFQDLTRRDAAVQTIEVQTKKEAEAAQASKVAAEVAVDKAKSDLKEAEAKLAAAGTDVTLKDAMIHRARSDLKLSTARLSFSVIDAPFKGKITQRNVDPGSFVQNAATARAKPLLSLQRTDVVTVYMKLPDTYASYVTPDTEAVVAMRNKNGKAVEFHGKVTRYSDSLQNPEHDRTMRVEVDLFNGTAAEWEKFRAEAKASNPPYADLKSTLLSARTGKPEDKLPSFPGVKGTDRFELVPGMYGRMRLLLNTTANVYMVPSYVIVSEGGESYVYLVRDGTAHKAEVRVQANNGKLARIALVGDDGGARELSGAEEIVASNASELSEGQAVNVHRLGKKW